eukprot:gene5121-160_t
MIRAWNAARTVITEAFAPVQRPALEEFKEIWKHVSDLIIHCEQHDDTNVLSTSIPKCIDRLVEILCAEEKAFEGEAGPCMEYMYTSKIIKMIVTMGTQDAPEGMLPVALSMLHKLLGNMTQPMLAHREVFPFLQQLLRRCIDISDDAETSDDVCMEIATFVCAICSQLNSNPNFAELFIEEEKSGETVDSKQMYPRFLVLALATNLLKCNHAETARLAHEATALCFHLENTSVKDLLTSNNPVFSALMDLLLATYADLPQHTSQAHPILINTVLSFVLRKPSISWQSRRSTDLEPESVVRPLYLLLEETEFICHLMSSAFYASYVESFQESFAIHFLRPILESKLLQGSEDAADIAICYLTMLVNFVQSDLLLDTIAQNILSGAIGPVMISRCDDLSEQLSITTLRFFVTLLARHNEIAFHLLIGQHITSDESSQSIQLKPREAIDRLGDIVPSHLCTDMSDSSSRIYFETVLNEMQKGMEASRRWKKMLEQDALLSYRFSGTFLQLLLSRLSRLFDQSYDINVLVTTVLMRILQHPVPAIRRSLLLRDGKESLLTSLERLNSELLNRAMRLPDIEAKLKFFRSEVMSGSYPSDDNASFYLTIILVEELVKELVAVVLIDANDVILA